MASAVWYRITGNGNRFIIDTCNNVDFDTYLHVFRGDCNGLVCVLRDDDGCGASLGSRLSLCTSNMEYYIAVDGYHGRWGTFDLNVVDTGAVCTAQQLSESQALNQQQSLNPRDLSIHSLPRTPVYAAANVTSRDLLAVNEQCQSAIDLDTLGFPNSYVEVRASTKTSLAPVSFACRSSEAPGLWYRFRSGHDGAHRNLHSLEQPLPKHHPSDLRQLR